MSRKHRAMVENPFTMVDGEGGRVFIVNSAGETREHHTYLLLRAGEYTVEASHAVRGLTWIECLTFITNLPTSRQWVSFAFDYDVSMMLRGLPEERLRRLMDREARTREIETPKGKRVVTFPLDVGRFQLDYMPHKEFRVRRVTMVEEPWDKARRFKMRYSPWIIVSDVFTFFQMSFLKAITLWDIGTPEQRAMIEQGKRERNLFAKVTAEERQYNELETTLGAELMEEFRRVCLDTNCMPVRWQGPGNMATGLMNRHGVPHNRDYRFDDPRLLEWSQAAYYGGRFETTITGPVRGPVYQYDINSAYPAALRRLPCLLHGAWTERRKLSNLSRDSVYVAPVQFAHSPGNMLYHLPIRRKDGSICYPRMGNGWYWSPEIDAANRHGADSTITRALVYERQCDCQPFAWVETLYQERLRVGKTTRGMVLKLGANSIYGKTAQSIGTPTFANPIWAGLITAYTRAMLIDAYSQAPGDVFMLATDGIFSGVPLKLAGDERKLLGEWDKAVHPNGLFIIQPGLYFSDDVKPKTRGVPQRKVEERRAEFEVAWERYRETKKDAGVTIPMRNFIGIRLGLAWNRPGDIGQWIPANKVITFDWSSKRRPIKTITDLYGVRTLPYDGGWETIPYSRTIGGNLNRNEERAEEDDAPDWADTLRIDHEPVSEP